MKRLLLIIPLMLLAVSAYAFDFGLSLNFAGGQKKCTDLLPIPGFTPTSVAFGNHSTGTTTDSIVTLANTGTAQLTAAELAVSGTSFTLQSTTCGSNPFDLAAGADCTATVRFAPLTASEFTGSLTMSAPNLDDLVAGLSGTGTSSCTETPGDFYVYQNFEGTGYDNSETWTEVVGTGGVVDEDDTTAPIGKGSQQLKISAGNSGQTSNTYVAFSQDLSTAYAHFKYKFDSLPGANTTFGYFRSSTGGIIASLIINTTGTLRIIDGSNSVTTTGAMSAGTWYHIWIRYTAGTGSDGVYSVAFSTDPTAPTAGSNFASGTNGTVTTSPRRLMFQEQNQHTGYFDNVHVDDVEIASVCP